MAEEFNLKFKLSLDNKDELSNTLKKAERDAKSFSATLSKGLADGAKQIAGFAASNAKSLSQLATGDLGIASNAKKVLELRNNIAALSVAAGKGAAGIEPLRQEIHRIAQASNQMQDDVTAAFAAFVAKTGDLDTAKKNMELYGRVALATSASLQDVANVGVELKDKMGIKEQAAAMSILVQQAKLGAIEFKEMAAIGPKVLAAAAISGLSGEAGLKSAGAGIQVVASGFGGRGQAASGAVAYENMLKTLQTAKSRGRIEDLGIQVAGRDPNAVFVDILRKTGGDTGKLREIFTTMQGFRGISAFAKDMRNTDGEFALLNKVGGAKANDKVINDDFNVMRNTGLAALNASQIKIAKSIDDNVGPAFERLTTHADKLARAIEFATAHPYMTASAAVAAVLGAGVIKSMIPALITGGGGGGPLSKLLGKAGVQHVWVDNPDFGGPGGANKPPAVLPPPLKVIASALALPAAALAYAGVHKAGLDFFGDGDKRYSTGIKADLAAGRKRAASHWYNFGGVSYENVPANEQAKAAADYQKSISLGGVTVNINDDKASAEVGGTRSEAVVNRRSAYGAF